MKSNDGRKLLERIKGRVSSLKVNNIWINIRGDPLV